MTSSGVILCTKCKSDNWAAVMINLLFIKVTTMYCEICGNSDGVTYEKFQELMKGNNKKKE